MESSERIHIENRHFENIYRTKKDYLLNLCRKEAGNFQDKAKIVKDMIRHIQNPKILELGCGLGDFTKYIDNFDLYACDVSSTALSYVKETLPKVKLFNTSIENLNFEDESFDAVVGCGILHHADLKSALAQVKRILKPGGYFAFFEPNLNFLESYLLEKFNFFRKMSTNSPTERYFSRKFIYNELSDYKFKKISVEPYFSYHPKLPKFLIPCNIFLNKIFKKTSFEYGARELFISGQK